MLENVEGVFLFVLLCARARAYVGNLDLCIRSSILMYTGLFVRLCVRGDGLAYAGSCLCMWALTSVHEVLSRGLTLPIFTFLSTVSLLYAILTPLFVIFASEHLASSFSSLFLHRKHHFCLNQESNVIFFLCNPHPLMLVREAPIRGWSGTTFSFLRLGLISGKRALSLSLAFFWKGPQVLLWCNASSKSGGILLTPFILLRRR